MKIFLNYLKSIVEARRLFFFSLILFGGMAASKMVHILWFEENDQMVNFGLSYSAMAVTGAFSFFIGYIIDRFGITTTIRIGAMIYSIGLALRIFTDSPTLAIISGIVAGVGASTTFISIRPWILSWAKEDDRTLALSVNSSGGSAGTALGTLLGGVMVAGLVGAFSVPIAYQITLIFAALFPLISSFFIPSSKVAYKKETQEKSESLFSALKNNFSLTLGVIFFGSIGGLYTSIVAPYIPIFLKNQGITIDSIGIIIALITLIIAFVNPIVGSIIKGKTKYKGFIIGEVSLSIITILLIPDYGVFILVILLMIRSIFITISSLTEQTIQMSMFPKKLTGMYFGFAQSSFWFGDTIGGSIGGWLYNFSGQSTLLITASILILINAIGFPMFSKIISKRYSDNPSQELRSASN